MDRNDADQRAAKLGAEVERATRTLEYLGTISDMSAAETCRYVRRNGGARGYLHAFPTFEGATSQLRDAIAQGLRDLEAAKAHMSDLEGKPRPLPGSQAEAALRREVEQAEVYLDHARYALFRLEQHWYSASAGVTDAFVEKAKVGQRYLLEAAVRMELEATVANRDLNEDLQRGRQLIRNVLARLSLASAFRAEVEQVIGPIDIAVDLTVDDLDALKAVAKRDSCPELRPIQSKTA